MTYSLIQLAPGAYDLFLHDKVVASVVRNGSRQPYAWTAELLDNLPRIKRPSPFRDIEHSFSSLEAFVPGLAIQRYGPTTGITSLRVRECGDGSSVGSSPRQAARQEREKALLWLRPIKTTCCRWISNRGYGATCR
jgi:hypothetical protein